MKRILFGMAQAVLAAAAIHALVLALRGGSRPAPAPLVDEQAGRIRAVEVHYAPGSEFVHPTYLDFFRQLPADVEIFVAVEKLEHAAAFEQLVGRRAKAVVTGKPITTWARDRFLILADGTVIAPAEPQAGCPERINDADVPFLLARAMGEDARKAGFRFDGGDFCAAYGKVFCSSTWTARNPERSATDLIRLAEGTFSQPVVWLPVAPRHHVGMVFVPVGGKRFLVGDVRWGRRLAPAGLALDESESIAAEFDAAAASLVAAGYEVTRVPVLPTAKEFAWITYTNAILEDRVVYLPQFGRPALDAAAAQVYRDLGFEVRPVDVSQDYEKGGTLHCLVHVLRRD
ncbi:MAG: agmatine deiminase family protein [Planctomycetes bacterium]|nr:agmatine deiminase family protein [Planctomycetota bacterium]